MNRLGAVLFVVAMVLPLSATAQFKSQAEQGTHVSDGLMASSAPSLLLGWFDPSKFSMRHSFSLSYSSFGDNGISLGTYTNSMSYEFAQNLRARADVSMSYSPFNTLPLQNGRKNDLSSIYLSNASLDYKPWDNVMVQFQYRTLPYGSYYNSPFSNPWYRENGF
jgi:hypothetical protein